MLRAYSLICACVMFVASGCGGSCGSDPSEQRAVQSVLRYLPADAPFAAISYPAVGDVAAWDGTVPEDATPSQIIAATAADLFGELGAEAGESGYGTFGPGAFGGFYDGQVFIALFEMSDSDGFFEAFVSSMEAPERVVSRNVQRLDGDRSNSAVFQYRGILRSSNGIAAVTAHDGLIAIAVGADELRDAVLDKSRNLEVAEIQLDDNSSLDRALSSVETGRTSRLAVAVESSRMFATPATSQQSDACRAAESRLFERFPKFALVLSEGQGSMSLEARLTLNEETLALLDNLFSSAFDVTESLSTDMPVAFSIGMSSGQILAQDLADPALSDCNNAVGTYARALGWVRDVNVMVGGSDGGERRVVVGVESLGVDILAAVPRVIARTVWTDEAHASQAISSISPNFAELEPVGTLTFDGEEKQVRQLLPAIPPTFFAQDGAELWLSNHQFSEASVASMLTVRDADVPLMLAISPTSMRRLLTMMQRQMESALEDVISQYPAAEVDRERVSAVLEWTNYLADKIKSLDLVTLTATLDDGDLLIEIR